MKLQKLVQSFYINKIRAISLVSKKKAASVAFDIFCWPFTRVNYKAVEFFDQAELLEMKFDGLLTHGYRWNKGGSPKVCIAHGFRSSAINFGHIVKRLIKNGCEVVAFDAPGHGLSQGNRITAIIYKRFLEKLNEQYGPFDSYLGHSFGGLAICFAVAEMKNNANIRIALIAPASDTQTLAEEYFRQMKIRDKKIQQYFFAEIEAIGKNPIEWFTIKRSLQTIQSKILWVHDEEDLVTPVTDALALQKAGLPNVQIELTRGLGHRKIYRDEKVVKQVVGFLS